MQIRLSSLLFIVLTSLLFNCKNNKPDINHEMIGKWELRKTSSIQNKVSKTFPPGKGTHLFFDSTRYREFYNNSMTSMGRYRIARDTMRLNGEIADRIFFKPEIYAEDSTRFFISVKDSLLIITGDFAEGVIRFYERLQ